MSDHNTPQAIQAEIRNLLAYCESTPNPSRERVASQLQKIAAQVSGETESKTASNNFDIGMVDRIKTLTGRNHHAEAYLFGAKMLGAPMLAKKFSLVQQLQDLEGHRPQGLGEYQYGLYKQMMQYAKQVLRPEEYELFYQAF